MTIVGDSVHGQGLAWGEDGWIYYSGGAPGELALLRVREDGGAAEIVARPDSTRDELFYFSPALVDGGRGVLFTIWRRTGLPDIGVVDLESGAVKTITGGTTALHTPTPGILVTSVYGPIMATNHPTYSKAGTASSFSILGLIGIGDASIDRAAKDGGITQIHHVDYQLSSFLVFFTKYRVLVYGD